MKVINFTEIQIKNYIEKIRPPKEIREQVDISYSIIKNTIEIFEIRPDWIDEKTKINIPVARAKYIKSRKIWRIYWLNSSDKWLPYKPSPEVNRFSDFITLLEKDTNNCFWE
ncbi:DUF3024 domain-containing protein [uncultured Polaribacter sp.]|uniref:DUF3024 domain-containing protein n=1 Tax=uncultured Polaribacter sp. TaxID=174711 RepID=UPI0026217E37|nr:DUF3024 domain-containing protein [uncultured Polaribacter sp.]